MKYASYRVERKSRCIPQYWNLSIAQRSWSVQLVSRRQLSCEAAPVEQHRFVCVKHPASITIDYILSIAIKNLLAASCQCNDWEPCKANQSNHGRSRTITLQLEEIFRLMFISDDCWPFNAIAKVIHVSGDIIVVITAVSRCRCLLSMERNPCP